MIAIIEKIVRVFFLKMQNDCHVDPKNLRIRIPPDKLILCLFCASMYSTAHADSCPCCK